MGDKMILTISAIVISLICGYFLGKRSRCDLNFEVSFSNGQRLFFMGGNNRKDIIHKVSKLLAEIRELEEKEERASEYARSVNDLLYHLSDLMHDCKEFDAISTEELSDIFASARMLTNNSSKNTSTTEIINFIMKLREDVFPRLCPSYSDADPMTQTNPNKLSS